MAPPLRSRFLLLKLGNTPVPALFMSTDKTQQRQVPCAIALIRCQATQLRNELVKVSEQKCCTSPEPDRLANQLKLALRAAEEVLSTLQECENIHADSEKAESLDCKKVKSLTIFERASMFQSWDMHRRHKEVKQDTQQQQKAVKRKLSD